jgi:uncharacterized protein (TIGR02757 family)
VDASSLKPSLEALYERLNRREFVHPDPIEFLYAYDDVLDREIAALVAASLAYGRVAQILGSVEKVLAPMGPSPRAWLDATPPEAILDRFKGFRHRVTSGEEMAMLLIAIRQVNELHGSLEACFIGSLREDDDTVLPALTGLISELTGAAGHPLKHLLPSPVLGSACKRCHLFLRWMVRRDAVDPGGWNDVPPAKLVVPLDTHMHHVGLALSMTRRRTADLRAALEVTEAFRSLSPDDPVRYDFALTRLGIRSEENLDTYLAEMAGDRIATHG